jgi:metal-responsive CopG/Arc/MetJ family transcriptional regulator
VKVISLSVEKDLLDRADAYAKCHGMKRAEFFSSAVLAAMSGNFP